MNPFNNIDIKNQKKLLGELEALTLVLSKDSNFNKMIKNTNYIAIIQFGLIDIIKTDYNGNRTIIETLSDNDIFGSKISSLDNSEYSISIKEDTEIIILDYDQIFNYSKDKTYYNQFLKNILEIIINKVNDKNDRIEILTNKTIRNKLLEYFNITSLKNHSKNIYLPFSLSDLADYLAIDRSAMMRELKHLKEDGFIEVKKRKITLLY